MLSELVEQDHCQEAGPEEASRRRIKWRRRLGDCLAVPAGELLPDGLRVMYVLVDLLGLGKAEPPRPILPLGPEAHRQVVAAVEPILA